MNIAGIIGGIGPESTVDYYQTIISKFQERIGSKEILPELIINSINIIQQMVQRDQLQGIILGCTELPMIIKRNDLELPMLNTTDPNV